MSRDHKYRAWEIKRNIMHCNCYNCRICLLHCPKLQAITATGWEMLSQEAKIRRDVPQPMTPEEFYLSIQEKEPGLRQSNAKAGLWYG